MKGSTLKGKLAQGQATIGTWITSYDPAVAEIVANLGFHWAIIDLVCTTTSLKLSDSIIN